MLECKFPLLLRDFSLRQEEGSWLRGRGALSEFTGGTTMKACGC